MHKVSWFAKFAAALAAASALACAPVSAGEAPAVRLVTPYPAGGPADVISRVISPALAEELGSPVVVDNKSGASGTIGAADVARSAPDGATLLFNTSIQVVLPHLMTLPYDSATAFTPLAQVNDIPFVLVVNKDLPFKTVAELVGYAKANPGKLNFATNSAGGASHLAAEQFARIAGIDIVHIPYKGSAPALTDLVGGRVQIMFEQGPSVLPFLKSDRLRALAVTSARRTAITPDVPTFGEEGYPQFVYSNWQGIWGPAGMSGETRQRLSDALARTLARADVRKQLADLGTEPSGLTGAEFEAFVKQQYDYAGEIIRSADIKLN